MRATLTSSQEILAGESINNFAQAKVDKIVSKIKLNKKVNKVEVALKDGKIYIVRGYLTYLASQKAGVAVTKYFVDNRKIVEVDQSYWLSLVESQKNK